jgi:hypothetical protein
MIREVDENGKAKRIMGIEQDITERKQLEHKLEVHKELGKIVEERKAAGKRTFGHYRRDRHIVGHDIRNPLQAIVSELFLAKR